MADQNLTHEVTKFSGTAMTVDGTRIKVGARLTARQADLLQQRAKALKREGIEVGPIRSATSSSSSSSSSRSGS